MADHSVKCENKDDYYSFKDHENLPLSVLTDLDFVFVHWCEVGSAVKRVMSSPIRIQQLLK